MVRVSLDDMTTKLDRSRQYRALTALAERLQRCSNELWAASHDMSETERLDAQEISDRQLKAARLVEHRIAEVCGVRL